MPSKSRADWPVGLADNGKTRFECGTCEYMGKGVQSDQCGNSHDKLHGKHVERQWCCNLYDRSGMKQLIGW